MKRYLSAVPGVIALAALTGGAIEAAAQTVPSGGAQGETYRPYRAPGRAAYRPLTVKRRVSEPTIAAIPVPPPPAYGPAVIVTAPAHAASAIVGFPFRVLGGVFPATGSTPLVLIGAPIQAAGEIAQLPFRMVDAVFPAPYPIDPIQ